MDVIFPTLLKKLESGKLGIDWNDGHQSAYTVRALRLECRCAACVDEWTREARIVPSQIPENIYPAQIQTVGRYAVNFSWSDGHSTGYYPFEHLRQLCECAECQQK